LFIDEAYSLASSNKDNDFGREAVAELIQFMEDNRGRIAVIAAGYDNEMDEFIETNPGLRSRFANFVQFEPYTPEEMLEIFTAMATAMGIEITHDVEAVLREHFESVDSAGALGNARYARELFSAMCSRMNVRAYEDGVIEAHELTAFMPSDLPPVDKKHLKSSIKKGPVGFQADARDGD